jgi:hypothetical protein
VTLLLNPERMEAEIGSEIKTIQEEVDANQKRQTPFKKRWMMDKRK